MYLIDLAEALPSRHYKMGACFIQLLRTCINKHGFQVLTGIKPLDDQMFGQQQSIKASEFTSAVDLIDRIESARSCLITQKSQRSNLEAETAAADTQATGMMTKGESQWSEQKRDLSIVANNIDIVPHMANLFILKYLPEKCNVFPEQLATVFMIHLVNWLNTRRFLSLELQMAKATGGAQSNEAGGGAPKNATSVSSSKKK